MRCGWCCLLRALAACLLAAAQFNAHTATSVLRQLVTDRCMCCVSPLDDVFGVRAQGSYLYPDSSLYSGSWKAGKKHGQGAWQSLQAATISSAAFVLPPVCVQCREL